MSESKVTVLEDSGYIEDIEKHCERTPSSKKGTPLRQMMFLFEREDSISIKSTSSYTGLNKHSGKRWFRQSTNYQYTFKFRELKNGRKYLYIWDIPTNRNKRSHPYEITPYMVSLHDPVMVNKLVEFCEKNAGPIPAYIASKGIKAAFDYYSKPNTLLLKGLSPTTELLKKKRLSLRTSNPDDIMKAFMGDRYSKKLSGLLRNRVSISDIQHLSFYPLEFKSDWIIEHIRTSYPTSGVLPSFHLIQRPDYIVETIPESFRRKFFTAFLETPYIINDMVRMLQKIGMNKENFKEYKKYFSDDLRESHDQLSIIVREMEDVDFKKPYELDPLPEGLSELGFRLPEHSKDLSVWSNHFSNCVSGYTSDVSNKRTTVLNYNDEVCLEIRDKKLVQYLGKRNQPVSPKEFWAGVDILMKYDMINEQPNADCWGYQPALEKELV